MSIYLFLGRLGFKGLFEYCVTPVLLVLVMAFYSLMWSLYRVLPGVFAAVNFVEYGSCTF